MAIWAELRTVLLPRKAGLEHDRAGSGPVRRLNCLAERSQGGAPVDGAEFGSVLLCTVSDVGGVCSVGVARLVWVSVAVDGCSVCGEGVGVRRGGFFCRSC